MMLPDEQIKWYPLPYYNEPPSLAIAVGRCGMATLRRISTSDSETSSFV
jgi:hypothetical protein